MKSIEVRKQKLDKFYTKEDYSKKCIDSVLKVYKNKSWNLVIEPSAGNGSFLLNLPFDKKIGIDILPEHKSIIQQDFLKYTPNESTNILIIGNPPFGKNCNLAINFFNHSAKFADVIAFIIPRTFRKTSVQNKLNLQFHLIYDEDTPTSPCCFIPKLNVKCCFQIWEKKKFCRNIKKLNTTHKDWIFLNLGDKDENNQPNPPSNADFAIRAYGGKCGEIIDTDLNTLRPKSWHWIKSNINIQKLKKNFKSLDFKNSFNTARQNSIGKGELVELYENKFNLNS